MLIKRFKTSSLFLVTIVILIGIIMTVFYLHPNPAKKTTVSGKPAVESNLVDLRQSQGISIVSDVPVQETAKIQEVIKIFENLKYQKDFVAAIGMFTLPQTTEEKEVLSGLLGEDLASLNDGKPSPRFTYKANFHIMAGYETESITKKGDVYYVSVKELRFIDFVKEDGDTPNLVLQAQDLTFELVNNQGTFQISKYYHANPTSLVTLKYEGFVAY
jgi:hypothetical protein